MKIEQPQTPTPISIQDRALDNLKFIRDTMESATAFTAISGTGQVFVGVSAILTTLLSWSYYPSIQWIYFWLVEVILAVILSGVFTYFKAKRLNVPLNSSPGRKFLLSFLPPMVAGAILTIVLFQLNQLELLPGVWLLLYGTGVVSAGTFSVNVVPSMGMGFMAIGILALFLPMNYHSVCLLFGFGGLHIISGWIIGRNYGG